MKLHSYYAACQEQLEVAKIEVQTATEKEIMKKLRADKNKRAPMKEAIGPQFTIISHALSVVQCQRAYVQKSGIKMEESVLNLPEVKA